MKSPAGWAALLATLGVGVIIALAGLPSARLNGAALAAPRIQVVPTATLGPTVRVSLDCDTTTAGIQSACNIPVPAGGTRTVAVIATNNTGFTTTIAAFNFQLYNPSCGGAGAPSHPQGAPAASGCTISAGAKGIFPDSIPDIAGASVGFPNLVKQAEFASGCAIGGLYGDIASGVAGTSTSFLSCFNVAGGETLVSGASVVLATQSFTVDVTAAGPIPLTLTWVSVSDDLVVPLAVCDSALPPPAPPANVSGPCFSAVLNFGDGTPTATPAAGGPTATATNTLTVPVATRTAAPSPTGTATSVPLTATPVPQNCQSGAGKIRLVIGGLSRLGAHSGQPGFAARFDLDRDGVIDVRDLLRVLGAPACDHGDQDRRGNQG